MRSSRWEVRRTLQLTTAVIGSFFLSLVLMGCGQDVGEGLTSPSASASTESDGGPPISESKAALRRGAGMGDTVAPAAKKKK
jgi:hypothetical protein